MLMCPDTKRRVNLDKQKQLCAEPYNWTTHTTQAVITLQRDIWPFLKCMIYDVWGHTTMFLKDMTSFTDTHWWMLLSDLFQTSAKSVVSVWDCVIRTDRERLTSFNNGSSHVSRLILTQAKLLPLLVELSHRAFSTEKPAQGRGLIDHRGEYLSKKRTDKRLFIHPCG